LFSREEERKRVHIIASDVEAMFWLEPEIELARNYRFTNRQLKDIDRLVEGYYDELISAWRQYFGS